ncbi:MAG: DUF3592 domain-containing protein [bacterium]
MTESRGPGREPGKPGLPSRKGIQVSMIGGAVGLLVGIGAPIVVLAVMRSQAPPGSGPPAYLFAVVAGIGVAVLVGFVLVGRAARRQTAALLGRSLLPLDGLPARATVVALSDTGVSAHRNPQVRFELEVQGRDGGTYRVSTTAILSRLVASRYQPGCVVNVTVDPRDPQRVALADLSGPGTGLR